MWSADLRPPSQPAPHPTVSTPPGFGGGTDEIALLLGDANVPPHAPNAHAFKMTATFWIETILETITLPVFKPGGAPITIQGNPHPITGVRPTFVGTPPHEITVPHTIVVPFTQIQYTQTVFLNFNGLTWPHVSVATLTPSSPTSVPASAWT